MSKKKLPNGVHESEALNADDRLGAEKDLRIPGGDTIRQTMDEKDTLVNEPQTEIRYESSNTATTDARGLPTTRNQQMGDVKNFIAIRRVDNITYELVELRDGEQNSIMKDAFSVVFTKAQYILQSQAEGRDV